MVRWLTAVASASVGALSTMPAVKSFALYAALAVLMDFVLQMTAFVALLSLDARRQDSNRCELLCCVTVSSERPNKPNEGVLLPLMRKYYAPVLLHRCTRFIVVWIPVRPGLQMASDLLTTLTSQLLCCPPDVGVPLHVLWFIVPYVQRHRGSGSGAGHAKGQ